MVVVVADSVILQSMLPVARSAALCGLMDSPNIRKMNKAQKIALICYMAIFISSACCALMKAHLEHYPPPLLEHPWTLDLYV